MNRSFRPAMLAGAVAVVVLFAAFGTGYSAARLAQSDGGVWLTGEKNVLHVNTASNVVDSRAGSDRVTPGGAGAGELEIVVRPNGDIIARNPRTGEVFRIDPTTNQVVAAEQTGKSTVLVGGQRLYLVENDKEGNKGTIVTVDEDFRPLGAPQALPGGVNLADDGKACPGEGRAAVDPAGVAWIGMSDGRLARVDEGEIRTVDIPNSSGRLCVTLVEGQPMVVDAARRQVSVVRSDGTVNRTLALPEPGSVPNAEANTLVSMPGPGPYLWVVVNGSTTIVRVDPNDTSHAAVMPADLPGEPSPAYGRPTVVEGRVYVPDLDHRRVYVLDARTAKPAPDTPHIDLPPVQDTPSGRSGPRSRVEIVGKDGKVFINDPAADRAVVVGSHGGNHGEVDKTGGASGPAGPGEQRDDTPGKEGGNGGAPVYTGTPGEDPNAPTTTTPADPAPEPIAPTSTVAPNTPSPQEPPQPSSTPANDNSNPQPPNGRTPAPVRQVAVPPVSGTVGDACLALQGANLRCQVKGFAPNAEQRALPATGTSPAAGNTVQEGTVISVIVPSKPRVPSVVGKQRAQACHEIEAHGLRCNATDTGSGAGADQVTSQSPQTGTEVDKGSVVNVAYVPLVAKVRVPTLLGKGYDIATACQKVKNAGLRCRQVEGGAGDKANQVLDQDPQPTTEVAAGSEVRVTYVSVTNSVTVPNVAGLTKLAACEALKKAGGLVCDPQVRPAGKAAGVVVEQTPKPDTSVAAGSAVKIVYYKAVLRVPNGDIGKTTCTEVLRAGLSCTRAAKPGGALAPGLNYSVSPAVNTPVDPGTQVTLFYDPTVLVPGNTSLSAASPGKSGAVTLTGYRSSSSWLYKTDQEKSTVPSGFTPSASFSVYTAIPSRPASCSIQRVLYTDKNGTNMVFSDQSPGKEWKKGATYYFCQEVRSGGLGDSTPAAVVLFVFTAAVVTVQRRRSRAASPLSATT